MSGYVGIPTSYTPVEYLESSGTQFIDTGVLAYNNELSLQFQYTNLSSVTYVCGSSDGTNRFGLIANRPANNDICYGDKDNNYSTLGIADTNVHTVVYNNSSNQVLYDGVLKGTLPNLTAQVTRPFGLFALSGTSGASTFASVKIMYCKIKNKSTNELIRDFIPALDENNVACLYETVEGKFYYNQGSGTFTAGTAGTPVSIGDRARKITKAYVGVQRSYTPVEYIESSGTQYIDTGYSANSNTKLELKLQFTSASHQEFIFCGRDFNNGSTINAFSLFRNTSNQFRVDYSSVGTLFSHTVTANNNYTYVMDKNKLYENNVLIRTETSASFSATNKLRLFSAFNPDSTVNNFFEGKVFYCKIWNNDTLVRDFIPAVDQDNVACLYDLVEGKFYYNQGSGIFTAGSATGQPVILGSVAREIKKGYVGVNGVARKIFPGSLTFTTSQIGTISYPRYGGMASTTDYVVHAGGHNSGNTMSNTTEFFDANGTKTTGSALSTKRFLLGAATFNDRAFFCGGATSSSWNTSSTVEYFNNSKVRSTGTSLSTSTYGSQAIANGLSYLMVCGGNVGDPLTNMVNFFNTSLTRTTNTLTTAVKSHSVGQINGYAIVAGGADNSAAKTTAQSFDTNGTKTNLAALPVAKAGAALASTEKYFFMLGGSSVSATGAGNKTVYVYDKNLVLTSAPDLSAATSNVSGSDYNKEYAIVPTTTTIIDIYDSNLTRSSISALGYSYEWGGYGRNASSIPNAMIYSNNSGAVFMVKGE